MRRLLLGRLPRCSLDFGGEPARHLMVAEAGGQLPAFLQGFDRARYVALAEKRAGLAEDTRVALSLFGGIHEPNIRW